MKQHVVAGLVVGCVLMALADTEVVDGVEWTYTICNGGAELGASGGYAIPRQSANGSIIIPDKLGGWQVTSIGNAAFYGFNGMTAISIPNTVKSIGRSAFKGCGLTSLTIPRSVGAIGGSAFAGCLSLETIDIQSSNLWTEDSVFWNCTALRSITIPACIGTIARQMFEGCTSLDTVTIANGVSSIENGAFRGCSDLRTISLPASVSSIGDGVFYGCSSLSSIEVDASNPRYQSVEGVLYDKNITKIVAIPVAKVGAYEIPNTITAIAEYALSDCSSLTSVVIPNGVVTIGAYAFFRCKSLREIVVPSSVSSIGRSAFAECSSLVSVSIPAAVERIEDSMFAGCNALVSVSLPYGLVDVGENAFAYCESLVSLVMPEGVTVIGPSAFLGCTNLVSVSLPSAITDIPAALFAECSSLKEIVIPFGVKSIGASAFARCVAVEAVKIPSSVTTISSYAFSDCWKLESVLIPNAELDQFVFSGCKSLKSVEIAAGVDYIPAYSFSGCSLLMTAAIPSSVKNIDVGAFENCTSLSKVLVDKGDAERIKGMMSECKSGLDVTSISFVENVCAWEIGAAGNEGGVKAWTNSTGRLIITGSGSMTNFTNAADVPWDPSVVLEVECDGAITPIGKNVFAALGDAVLVNGVAAGEIRHAFGITADVTPVAAVTAGFEKIAIENGKADFVIKVTPAISHRNTRCVDRAGKYFLEYAA